MNNDLYRLWQFFLFTVTLCVLFASFYFQFVKDLQPCPLCIMQRICVIAALSLFILGAILGRRRGTGTLIILQIIIAVAGLYFASRQLWLQSLPPDELPACLPGLDVLIRYFPWQDVLHALIWGAADCGEVHWQWLGLTMPAWCAIYFTSILIAAWVSQFILNQSKAISGKAP